MCRRLRKFWVCDNKNKTKCEFFCLDEERPLYETAMMMWKANGAIQPQCYTHQRLAKMKVVKDRLLNLSGRNQQQGPPRGGQGGGQLAPGPKQVGPPNLRNTLKLNKAPSKSG